MRPVSRASVELMEDDDKFWTKVGCPERLTVAGPPYDDVAPFARRLVEASPTASCGAPTGRTPT